MVSFCLFKCSGAVAKIPATDYIIRYNVGHEGSMKDTVHLQYAFFKTGQNEGMTKCSFRFPLSDTAMVPCHAAHHHTCSHPHLICHITCLVRTTKGHGRDGDPFCGGSCPNANQLIHASEIFKDSRLRVDIACVFAQTRWMGEGKQVEHPIHTHRILQATKPLKKARWGVLYN